jgi:predicted nucleic acid-binding protein
MRFVDTNILLYALSTDPAEVDKAERAAEVLRQRDLALSVQVLQECYVQATRAGAPVRLDHDQAVAFLRTLRRFPVAPITIELMDIALEIRARWRVSYWDAAIVAAARMLGCDMLLTEDLQHGQVFDGVRVVNPFL